MQAYDLVVIGSGPGGQRAAIQAAKSGKRVAIADQLEDPAITLTTNRNRVVRAIYLACKLDFNIDASIISYVKAHPQTIKISTEKSLAEKLNEAFARDAKKAAYLLTTMGLWNLVPITEPMYPYYQAFLKGKVSQ